MVLYGRRIHVSEHGCADRFLRGHMANDAFPPVQVRAYLQDLLPKLKHWQIAENK